VPVASGTYAAAFTFGGTGPGLGVLYQDISTLAGQPYDLSFDFTANGLTHKTGELRIEVIGSSPLLNQTLNANPPASFVPYVWGFVADSSTTRIRFTDVSTDTLDLDVALDNVAMHAVPLPSTILLLLVGVPFTTWERKRKFTVSG